MHVHILQSNQNDVLQGLKTFYKVLAGFAVSAATKAVTAARTAATRVVLIAARMSSAATATTAARNSNAATATTAARNKNDSTQSKAKPQEPPRCLVSSSRQDVLLCTCVRMRVHACGHCIALLRWLFSQTQGFFAALSALRRTPDMGRLGSIKD